MPLWEPSGAPSVHHCNETLFSFTTTRDPGLRFDNASFS